MSDKVKVRQASIHDTIELYQLMNQYIVEFCKQPEPEENALKDLIRHLIENPARGLQFVAEENGDLLGFSTLYFTFSTLRVKQQAILNDLYIIPEARGKKVGEKLFQNNLKYIRENDFCSMVWETASDNKVAQAFYSKMGGKLSDWLYYEIS